MTDLTIEDALSMLKNGAYVSAPSPGLPFHSDGCAPENQHGHCSCGAYDKRNAFHKEQSANLQSFLIRTLEEHARVKEDASRIDWLEYMANQPDGLLLHSTFATGRIGIGLATGRPLRRAIDQAMPINAQITKEQK